MKPEIKVFYKPVNSYNSSNDEDLLMSPHQAQIYKVNILEKTLQIELTVAWLDPKNYKKEFKICSLDMLILNAMTELRNCVEFNQNGEISSIIDTSLVTEELKEQINNNQKECLNMFFKDILNDYKIQVNSISNNKFGVFYINEFQITDNDLKERLYELIRKQCDLNLKEQYFKI